MDTNCLCKEKTTRLMVEAEIFADPIWCEVCSANLDVDDFLIPNHLKIALDTWNHQFDILLKKETIMD